MTSLPTGFLTGPAPNPSIRTIDFKRSPLPEYAGIYATVIDGIMSPEECNQLVAAAENHTVWERAMVNVGGGVQMLAEDTRKCDRIIWDDQEIMDKLWARIEKFVPELKRFDIPLKKQLTRYNLDLTRLNNRMRILKYGEGEYFKPHYDGAYETPDGKEKSYATLHLYLNDAEHQPEGQKLVGGATTFWLRDRRVDVNPKMGSVLIFQHDYLLHSGDQVLSGTKITLRTDIMYKREN